MSGHSRWICGACHVNNMPEQPRCWNCGQPAFAATAPASPPPPPQVIVQNQKPGFWRSLLTGAGWGLGFGCVAPAAGCAVSLLLVTWLVGGAVRGCNDSLRETEYRHPSVPSSPPATASPDMPRVAPERKPWERSNPFSVPQ
ncbi:MAG: hypothetical protein ACO1SX_00200 [Actinomycetota bacterium]